LGYFRCLLGLFIFQLIFAIYLARAHRGLSSSLYIIKQILLFDYLFKLGPSLLFLSLL
jgi:hypothetical protein